MMYLIHLYDGDPYIHEAAIVEAADARAAAEAFARSWVVGTTWRDGDKFEVEVLSSTAGEDGVYTHEVVAKYRVCVVDGKPTLDAKE